MSFLTRTKSSDNGNGRSCQGDQRYQALSKPSTELAIGAKEMFEKLCCLVSSHFGRSFQLTEVCLVPGPEVLYWAGFDNPHASEKIYWPVCRGKAGFAASCPPRKHTRPHSADTGAGIQLISQKELPRYEPITPRVNCRPPVCRSMCTGGAGQGGLESSSGSKAER